MSRPIPEIVIIARIQQFRSLIAKDQEGIDKENIRYPEYRNQGLIKFLADRIGNYNEKIELLQDVLKEITNA